MVPPKLPTARKPLEWISSSLKDLKAFPEEVQDVMGFALDMAQAGLKHPDAKPLKGDAFKGSGVLEVVDDFDGDTYRAIYTLRFEGVVYVLDAFQKKSKSGITTPKADMDRIKGRLKQAQEHYTANYKAKEVG